MKKNNNFVLISVDESRTYQSTDYKKLSVVNSELYQGKGMIIDYSEFLSKKTNGSNNN